MSVRLIAIGVGILVIGLAVYGGLMVAGQDDDAAADIRLNPGDATLVAEGREIYRDACASCHGASLEGQPNWQQRKADGRLPAPPHDPSGHTWHHPDQLLFLITKHGTEAMVQDPAYVSDMPGFGETLSDRDIVAVLSYIKSTWPPEIQARHDTINARAAGG